ncbi:hypothetical protein PHAVU_004G022800 [Phaseolus vulgaris]
MASASISDPSLSTKKKRTNGSAKLKQIKLDVRREQWLSRGSDVDSNGRVDHCPSSKNIASEENRSSSKENGRKRGEDIEGSCIQGNYSGSIINNSIQNSFDLDESGSDFSGSSSSSSSSMSACFSGNVSDKEVDECLDDWEVVADALYANDNLCSVVSESSPVQEAAKNLREDFSKPEFKSGVPESHPSRRAWKPDDALRPQCLPNLSKQHSSLLNSNWHGNHKTVPCAWQTIMSQPPQCPICYEDFDMTDSSFLPCSCGFHLCLFCHKKILESDGRCPGCRKPYDHVDGSVGFNIGVKSFHFAQSFSMSTGC